MLKKLFCDILGWHKVKTPIGFDGASMMGFCKRCHNKCLQDSQGNWFTIESNKEK